MIEFYFKGLSTAPDYMITPLVRHGARGVYKHEYNPEKAKKLLAEAGYPNGFDTVLYSPNEAMMKGPATIMQSYMTQVGIRAELQAVDFGVFLGKVRKGKAPVWAIYNFPDSIIDAFITRWTNKYYPGNNWSGMNDPEYEKICKLAMEAPDDETKGKYFYDAQVRLVEILPWVPIETGAIRLAMHKKVKGFSVRADLRYSFENVYIED